MIDKFFGMDETAKLSRSTADEYEDLADYEEKEENAQSSEGDTRKRQRDSKDEGNEFTEEVIPANQLKVLNLWIHKICKVPRTNVGRVCCCCVAGRPARADQRCWVKQNSF